MHYLSIEVIRHFVVDHSVWAYFFIFIGVIFEGEIVVILAGIFSHLGSLNPLFCLLYVVLGASTKSCIGYLVGQHLESHHAHKPFVRLVERRIAYFLPNFKEKPFWSIFISRFFILGIGWFTLIYSGYKKISLKIFVKAEAFSLAIWSVLMLALGSFFSYTALSISRDVRKFLGIILVFFILFFLLEKIIEFILGVFQDLTDEETKEDIEVK